MQNKLFWDIYRLRRKVHFWHKNNRHSAHIADEHLAYEYEQAVSNYYENENSYEKWIMRCESGQSQRQENLEYLPKISIIVPVYNVLDRHLVPCIESVLKQTFNNWELCLADDCSTWDNVRKTLERYKDNERVKIVYRKTNGHISECTNSAINIATGEYIAFMDCDDLLQPDAIYEMTKKLNEDPTLDFIYSDEDKVDDDGKHRHMPHFKPDWSPDTLMSHMYTSHFSIYRKSIVDEIGGLRKGYEGAQDYDFTLRFTEKTNKIAHIPKVLYHWREREESTAGSTEAKPYVLEAAKRAKEDALARRGLKARLELDSVMYQYTVNYQCRNNPLVSIIIPSKDNFKICKRCIQSIKSMTIYKNYEIILVDNGSSEANEKSYRTFADKYGIIYHMELMEFNFSKMCNLGASLAKGDFYLFLNDDIEVIDGEWLERMLGQAQLEHTGAVGAKLLYPQTKNIQHCGVISIENGFCHAFANMPDDQTYYMGRNTLTYNYLAVTAACLLIDKKKFAEINGFDETLAVAYNDVDLCLKLVEAGYYNVVRNDVVLYHYESVSRGNDLENKQKFKRLEAERNLIYQKHPQYDKQDPFYNVHLTQRDIDFSLNNNHKDDAIAHIEESNEPFQTTLDFVGNIDNLHSGIVTPRVQGWAFILGREDNFKLPVRLLLESKTKRYVVKPECLIRKDVQAMLSHERNIGLSGFRCVLPTEQIEPGKYDVSIICGKWRSEPKAKFIL